MRGGWPRMFGRGLEGTGLHVLPCTRGSDTCSVPARGGGKRLSDVPDPESVGRRMNDVGGASLLARMSFVQHVGLLSEDYFLYFEEIDWATRGRGEYGLAYAPRSRVYHKEGRTAGSSSHPASRTTSADAFLIRSRIVYTRKFKRWALPTVCLAVAGMLLNRIRRGQWKRVVPMVRVAARSLVEKLGAPGRPLPGPAARDLHSLTSQ